MKDFRLQSLQRILYNLAVYVWAVDYMNNTEPCTYGALWGPMGPHGALWGYWVMPIPIHQVLVMLLVRVVASLNKMQKMEIGQNRSKSSFNGTVRCRITSGVRI